MSTQGQNWIVLSPMSATTYVELLAIKANWDVSGDMQ